MSDLGSDYHEMGSAHLLLKMLSENLYIRINYSASLNNISVASKHFPHLHEPPFLLGRVLE